MSLQQQVRKVEVTGTSWVFSAEAQFNPATMTDKDILSHAVYCAVTQDLTKHLFETQKVLYESLQGGLSVELSELTLEHFDLAGRFDRAVCNLHLANRGPARFLLETRFFLEASLVTLATQEGLLYFDELN
jgi:hypothetical protein